MRPLIVTTLGTLLAATTGCEGRVLDPDGPESVGLPSTNEQIQRSTVDAEYRMPFICGQRYWITQGNHGDMCDRNDGNHVSTMDYAWDFALPRHSPVVASRAGKVTLAANAVREGETCFDGCNGEFGSDEFKNCCSACTLQSNRVNVTHEDGTVATYWHLDEATVAVGQQVRAGEMLGFSGTSGCSTGPHLHFQVMGNCTTGWCQSQPINFMEGGVPGCGERIESLNCN